MVNFLFWDFGRREKMVKQVLAEYVQVIVKHQLPSFNWSELFTGDTLNDNHSPGPVIRGASA